MEYAIQTQNLSRKFKKPVGFLKQINPFFKHEEFEALRNININISKSNTYCLLGPNGAGKTTLIKILCTLISPTSGTAKVGNYDIQENSLKIRPIIGFASGEERSFYWRLTARQNLDFFTTLYGMSKKERAKRIEECADLLKMRHLLDQQFQRLSAGNKQRLMLIRSFIHAPEIIFLDEPTKSLDPLVSREIWHFIKNYLVKEKGKTVFFTTHNVGEAERYSDKIFILNRGRIILEGSPQEINSKAHISDKSLEDTYIKYINEDVS